MGRKITVIILDDVNGNEKKVLDEDENLIPNFPVKEFLANRDNGLDLVVVERKVLEVLPHLREVGGPVIVTSVLRTPGYNDKEGGASNSDHLTAEAFDIVFTRELSFTERCTIILILGLHGFVNVGAYKNKKQFHAGLTGKPRVWEG